MLNESYGTSSIFSIAQDGNDKSSISNDIQRALKAVKEAQPSGPTPLTRHIYEIRNDIVKGSYGSRFCQETLSHHKKRISIVIATDGLPSNERGISNTFEQQNFVHALKALEELPVWIVIRLCTSDKDILDFYCNLDKQFEFLSIDVIDDFISEAKEIHKCNKWLTYGLPLHRAREMGFHHHLFDVIDERKLVRGEVYEFLRLIFGDEVLSIDPDEDFDGFYTQLKQIVKREDKQWNPITGKMTPWIDLKKLKQSYKDKKFPQSYL